jgi:hypothetical protein
MLPLLQYALKETWTLRDGSVITGDSYAHTDGVREAIQLTASRVASSHFTQAMPPNPNATIASSNAAASPANVRLATRREAAASERAASSSAS